MFHSLICITDESCKNPYNIHKKLWELFPGIEDRPFLFQILGTRGCIWVEVQSERLPNIDQWKSCKYCRVYEFEYDFKNDNIVDFELYANCVKRLCRERCRVPLITQKDRTVWLKRHLTGAASIQSVSIEDCPPILFHKNNAPGKIAVTKFTGKLKIENTEKFLNIIRQGIGAAKAFGCGLIRIQ